MTEQRTPSSSTVGAPSTEHSITASTVHPKVLVEHLQSRTRDWRLADDDRLAFTLASLSRHMCHRIDRVCRAVERLESKSRRVSDRVAATNAEFLARSDAQFVDNRARDDDHEDDDSSLSGGDEPDDDDEDDNDSVDVEEERFLRTGMSALRLFLDPAAPRPMRRIGGVDDDGDAATATGGVLDSCYYYDSVEDDEFNHRPLPYVVGSREFRNSEDAGLGTIGDDDPFEGTEDLLPNDGPVETTTTTTTTTIITTTTNDTKNFDIENDHDRLAPFVAVNDDDADKEDRWAGVECCPPGLTGARESFTVMGGRATGDVPPPPFPVDQPPPPPAEPPPPPPSSADK